MATYKDLFSPEFYAVFMQMRFNYTKDGIRYKSTDDYRISEPDIVLDYGVTAIQKIVKGENFANDPTDFTTVDGTLSIKYECWNYEAGFENSPIWKIRRVEVLQYPNEPILTKRLYPFGLDSYNFKVSELKDMVYEGYFYFAGK